ncbi:UNVERIFIED_CONTAM: hypothetical protein HDU68_008550 [Siphonaria sp. JEL0065]|nr:hypothetical protein HDU68_008550 [Siphonaria sp. JEL0065]
MYRNRCRSSLSDLPKEVVVEVFKWLPPLSNIQLRRLCRSFNSLLLDVFFAALNLPLHPSIAKEDSDFSRNWIRLPVSYQNLFIETKYRTSSSIDLCLEAKTTPVSLKFPVRITVLTQLTRLVLEFQGLVGPLPLEIGDLVNLTRLSVSCNRLSGSIPESFQYLIRLKFLDLSRNAFTGPIHPCSLNKLQSLEKLLLYSNQFSGRILDSICQLTNLISLHLHQNQFTGRIPPDFNRLRDLKVLFLQNNSFSGSIASAFTHLTGLEKANLSFNAFLGRVPAGISSMVKLDTLRLDHNRLTGKIPKEMGSMLHLRVFRIVEGNKVAVENIPDELKELKLWETDVPGLS